MMLTRGGCETGLPDLFTTHQCRCQFFHKGSEICMELARKAMLEADIWVCVVIKKVSKIYIYMYVENRYICIYLARFLRPFRLSDWTLVILFPSRWSSDREVGRPGDPQRNTVKRNLNKSWNIHKTITNWPLQKLELLLLALFSCCHFCFNGKGSVLLLLVSG